MGLRIVFRLFLAAGTLSSSVAQQDRATFNGAVTDPSGTPAAAVRIKIGSGLGNAANVALGRWTVQHIGNYTSGWPLGIDGSGTPNSNFATNRGLALNPSGQSLTVGFDSAAIDMSRISQPSTTHRHVNTSVFADPVTVNRYLRGNTSYRLSQLRGPWQLSDDFSLQKQIRIVERLRLQLRADVLNAFNRTLWGNIETNASSPPFGQVTGASDWFAPRKLQFGIRADW